MMLKHIMIYNYIGSENIWIGIDDTDSITGGCTTYLGCTIIKKLIDENYDLIVYPRLVRLNPNIPWKTRGNGAITIHIGKGKGNIIKIGEINNEDIFCYQKSLGNYDDSAIMEIVENSVDEYARLDDENRIVRYGPFFMREGNYWFKRVVMMWTLNGWMAYADENDG